MDHASYTLDIKNLTSAGQIEGLAAGYGNVDSHGEIFAPGAFSKSLSSGDRHPVMLLHHDQARPIGKWVSLRESAEGLHVTGQIAIDASDGREAYSLLKAGALTGLSVGFQKMKVAPKGDTPTGAEALITEARLWEISLVSIPSNPKTLISGVKSFATPRDLEDHLREIGLSGRRAKAAAAAAFRATDAPDEPVLSTLAAQKLAAALSHLDLINRSF